jgi:hypothetical protein
VPKITRVSLFKEENFTFASKKQKKVATVNGRSE